MNSFSLWEQHSSVWTQKVSENYNSQICGHVNSRMSNSILGRASDDESQSGSNRTVIRQSCTNTSLFLCGLLGIVCMSRRPVFIKQQKKSPNKIRSHLDRKCSLLLPGIQTVKSLPYIVNLPLTQALHKKPVLLTSLLKPTPEVYGTSVQVKRLVWGGERKIYDILSSLSGQIYRFLMGSEHISVLFSFF